jgi:hypothetical protein
MDKVTGGWGKIQNINIHNCTVRRILLIIEIGWGV